LFAHFLHNFPTPIWSPNETNQGALFEQRLVAILLKKQIFLDREGDAASALA
jgi:hypothetical protein